MRNVAWLALLLAGCGGMPSEPGPPSAAGPAWTPFNDPENRHHPERVPSIDVLHYRIEVRVDDARPREIEGRTTVTLQPLAGARTIELDASDMTIASVTTAEGAPLRYRPAPGRVVIDLGRDVPKGERLALTLAYSARPTAGLFWVTPDAGYPDKPWMVWSQGETQYNHHWFPCYDFPNDPATSEVIVTYPAKYESVSNGRLVRREESGGLRTDHWSQELQHVSYLVSLVVGDLRKREETLRLGEREIPVQYFVPPGYGTDEEIGHAFGRTVPMMKFFSEKTGVAYPYAKYAQTCVVDFIWGGMENISATTLHEFTVTKKRSWMDRDSDGLIAHELAHQWFGDLVTCRDWAHIWLNESFATYFDWLWQEHSGGSDALASELVEGATGYFRQDREYRRPIVCGVYTDTLDIFDTHAYPKGGWVLHMLRKTVGDAAWWKGIKIYLDRHRAGVAATRDFLAAMEEASGQKLGWFFDQWLHGCGHPEFGVTHAWDAAAKVLRVTVEQRQKVTNLRSGPLVTGTPVFRTAADIEVETAKGRTNHRVWIESVRHEFSFPQGEAPLLVEFDPDGWILKKLDHRPSLGEVLYRLLKGDEAVGRREAAELLGSTPKPGPEELRAVAEALGKALEDGVPMVVHAAAKSLGQLKTPEARRALLTARVKDPRARWSVYQELGAFLPDDEVERALLNLIEKDESPNCRATAAAALGRKGAAAFDALSALAERLEKDEEVLPGVLSGIAAAGDPRGVPVLARFTRYGLHPWIRLRAAQCLGDLLAKQEKGKRDAQGLDALISLVDDPSFRVRQAVVQKLGALGEEAAAPAIEIRIGRESDGRMVKDLKKALRSIRKMEVKGQP